jgi:hypothetical protein
MQNVAGEYKSSYQLLKDQKLEIEHLHHLLDQARHRLTRDFEHWFDTVYMPTSSQQILQQKEPLDRNDSGLSSSSTAFDVAKMEKEQLTATNAAQKSMLELKSRSRGASSSVQDDIRAFYKARYVWGLSNGNF